MRHQWDPVRVLRGEKLKRRAIQIGIRGNIVKRYVNDWIVALEEVTKLAKTIGQAVAERQAMLPATPVEEEYTVDDELQRTLGIT